jgi:hypothetical protein
MQLSLTIRVCALTLAGLAVPLATADFLPPPLQGAWRVTRILPTTNDSCWRPDQARFLVGSVLVYRSGSMTWRGGNVPLHGITTRTLTAADFRVENRGTRGPANFSQIGIQAPSVTEVDLQHEDMDITGASTEVPGDSVLLAAPNRIVLSACGVYLEAVRAAKSPPAAKH